MKARMALFIVGSLLAMPESSFGQAQKGDGEILVFGTVFSTLGGEFSSTTANGTLTLGRFVTDRWQIGAGPSLTVSTSSQPGVPRLVAGRITTGPSTRLTEATIGLGFFVKRFFGGDNAKTFPYLGLDGVIQDFGSAGDTTGLGLGGGLKHYLSEKASLDVKGALDFNVKDPGASKFLIFTIGISYLF